MSLSKYRKLDNNYRRDSFGDRICDDLSEVILQFLPIEDKFRFECVSKQFQRTVFQRQYELITTFNMRINITTFETIVKKLANIKSLKSDVNLNDEKIEVIIKNCNHLIECNIDFNRYSTEIGKSFADRFGPQLTSISILDTKYNLIINSLVNILEIDFHSESVDLKDLIDFYTHFKPNNLKKISLSFTLKDENLHQFSDIQTNYFKTFIDNNKSITHLSLRCERNEMKSANLGSISQLNHLISLQLESNLFSEPLITDLKQIAVNCHKLKSLSLKCFKFDLKFPFNELMTEIKRFKELKRFEFYSISRDDNIDNFLMDYMGSGFEGLTHLNIYCGNCAEFKDNCLDSIDIILPNLQNLIISNQIGVKEETADILSRLSKLQVLKLNPNFKLIEVINFSEDFYFDFENKILEKCRKIKSFEILY